MLLMRRSVKATCREFQYGFDLFGCDIEPFRYLFDACSSLKIFKDGGYRHTRVAKNPRTADFAGNALHSKAV